MAALLAGAMAGVTLLVATGWTQEPSLELPAYPRFQGPISERATVVRPATVSIVNVAASGFGLFISEDGLILTNQHVVGDADTVIVRLVNGAELKGRVLRRHAVRDVALIKIEADRTPALPLRLEPLAPSEEVYTLGSPDDPNLGGTVTRGRVFARQSGDLPALQTDATVYGGGSGGPLLDASGNVVGIAATSEPAPSRSTTLNFFIPIGDALRYLNIRLAQPR
jgi:S1-C subfamily serine protease